MNEICHQELRIEMSGGSVYLKKWVPQSSCDNLPIILLHDSLGSVGLWRDFPLKLSQVTSRSVYAYDRLGFGKSTEREALPSTSFIEEEADLYFPLIKKQLGLEDYILLGHSVGGAMAINIAARDSDCRAVITLSAQAFVEDVTIAGVREAKKIFGQVEKMERLEKWHGPKASWVLRAWTELWLSDEFKDWSLEPAVRKLKCPVLTIHGDRDEYGSTAFPEFISRNTKGTADMLIVQDCGHMPHKEKASVVLGAITTFLATHL